MVSHPWLLGWELLSNYSVIPVVTVFCSQILVTVLTFERVTMKISESKGKVTSKELLAYYSTRMWIANGVLHPIRLPSSKKSLNHKIIIAPSPSPSFDGNDR